MCMSHTKCACGSLRAFFCLSLFLSFSVTQISFSFLLYPIEIGDFCGSWSRGWLFILLFFHFRFLFSTTSNVIDACTKLLYPYINTVFCSFFYIVCRNGITEIRYLYRIQKTYLIISINTK